MSTSFDITGRINAVVSSGSLRMLKKLQTELRATAKTLLKMGETSTANALGHTAMALDRVAGTAGKAAEGAKKLAVEADKTTKRFIRLKGETKQQAEITDNLAKSWKLSGGEIVGLSKAVGLLGAKYGYSTNMQKEWVPALQNSLTEINKQKAAMVASGKAITAHVTGQELFARTNTKLASGLHAVSGKFTDYDNAMAKSLGRSPAFRKEIDKVAGAVGKQGESFKSQFAAITKADNLWRKHVTNLHRAGEITTTQANKMYNSYDHLKMPLSELQAQLKGTTQKTTLLGRAMSSLVAHLKSFASYAAAASIISGVAGMFGLATRAIVKYDQALHDLQAITRATDAETALMGDRIREIGRTTKFSASEVAVAMRTLGQAGFTASEAVSAIGPVADLATGTLTSMKVVVDLTSTAIRAFGLRATEMGRVSDVFANAVNRSKLTIDKLRVAFNYIGPIAAKAGITFEETNATLMMMANAGIRASTSGTGLRRTIQQLIKPTDELKAAIEAAGYTTEDFNPQFNDMRDIIRRLAEVVPDAESAFRMFSLRSSAAVAALSSQGVASFDALHSSLLRTGSATEMAEKQIEGLGVIFKQALDKAHDLALAFGEFGVSGALKVFGKALQVTFDGLRFFVESGILKAIVTMGAMAAAIYGLSKAWAALKLAQWVIGLNLFVGQLGKASAATEIFGLAIEKLQSRVVHFLVLITALYALYKLHNAFLKTEVSKVSADYIDDLDEIHKKELERLEGIKNLVGVARDELATDRERSNALVELSDRNAALNLVIDEGTGLVENLTESLFDHTDALDEATIAFGKYKEKAKLEDLAAQAKLFMATGDAIGEVIPKARQLKEQTEGLFGKMVGKIEAVVDKIPLIGSSYESSAEKLVIYRKEVDALEAQHGETYEKMVTAVAAFGGVTQEVWKDYMLQAGASEEEVARLFTDSEEKITRVHLEAYMKIQLAREDMTKAEKVELKEYIALVGGLFSKVNNLAERRLAEGLAQITENYSERREIITSSYELEMQSLKERFGQEEGVYDDALSFVKRYSDEKLVLLKQANEDRKALIESQHMGMVKEQEKLAEEDKKFANRKLKIEQELVASISEIHGLQIEAVKKQHEDEISVAEKAFEKRKATVEDYYSWEATKAEQNIIVDEKAFDDRIAAEENYYGQKVARANQEIADQKVLQEALLDIEREKYLEILDAEEEHFKSQLEQEELYVADSQRLIEEKLATNAEMYKDDAESRKKVEKKLNDELLEIVRESRDKQEAIISKSYESRIESLSAWRDTLRESYSSAKDLVQSYADKVREIEEKIKDIRREGAEKIADIIETTEERITTARRAGMSESLILQDKITEARRKMAEADRLAAEGSIESQKKASKIYSEVQGIWTEVAVAAQTAAKEGKSVGVSYKTSMEQVLVAGSRAEGVVQGYINLQEEQKRKDQEAAKSARDYWGSVAESLEVSLGAVSVAMTDLDDTLREVNGLAARTRDAVEDIGLAAENVDLDSVIDVSGFGEAVESVGKLGEAYEALPSVLESTRTSMEDINSAAAVVERTMDDTVDSVDSVSDAYSEYAEEAEEAREKTEELSDIGKENEEVTYAQAQAADAHASALEKKTERLRGDFEAENKALKTAEKKLKVDKKALASAKKALAQLLKSGTATKEEIAIAKEKVAELKRTVIASEKHVEAQEKVAASAGRVVSALEQEAAAARDLANALSEVVVASQQMGAGLFTEGPTSSVSVTDFAWKIAEAVEGMSDKVTAALDKSQKRVGEWSTNLREIFSSGFDLTELDKMGDAISEIADRIKLHEESLAESCTLFASIFRSQVEAEKEALAVLQAFFEEAVRVSEVAEQLDMLVESLDETSGEYEEATQAARDFKGEVSETIAELMEMIRAAQETIDSVEYLDDEDLANLEGSIAAAKDRLVELTNQALAAKEALISIGEKLQDQLDKQLGNLTAIEERRYAAQIEEIERLYEESGKSAEATAAYLEALALAEEYHREKMAELIAEQNERELEAEAELHKKKMDDLDEYLEKLKEVGPKPFPDMPIVGFARGGRVPGSGTTDTVPAMLTPGEFILKSNVAKQLGTSFLNALNVSERFARSFAGGSLFKNLFASLPKFATGGSVDNILARLSPGEFVLKSDTVRQLGLPFLNALNNFNYPVPAFAEGGVVGESQSFAQAPQISGKQTGDVHLQVNITGAGEITEKQVRKWIFPAINKIQRLCG